VAEEPALEASGRTVAVLKSFIHYTWHLGVEDIERTEQRVAKTRQGILRMLACCEQFLQEKN
jgi:hypothetical protein